MTATKDPLRYFRVEAREISQELSRSALQLERDATPDLVARMLRLAHTLKGAAGVVKQREIADRTHALEDALVPLRDGPGGVADGGVDAVIALVDAIAAQVAALHSPDQGTPRPRSALEELSAIPVAGRTEMNALLEEMAETSVQVRGIRRVVGQVEQARRLTDLLADQAAPSPRDRRALEPSSGRTRRLTEDLRDILVKIEGTLKGDIDRAERELAQARAVAEGLQLSPCSVVFALLERTVRDVAQSVGKQAVLQTAGGQIRLEAEVLGLVQRALVQLVRNAVAHGIEGPAERQAAGKPLVGRIEIEVLRRGDRVAFVCSDDGAGIDLAAVRRAADKRGIPPSRGGEEELVRLLFKGGLSTSTAVTELSGRGVGLDVVREVVARAGGEVSASTEAGRGTRIELVVPVSLVSLEALMVEVGGKVCAIPLASVRCTLRVTEAEVVRTAEGDSILYDGEAIAFTPLARPVGRDIASAGEAGATCVVLIAGAAGLGALGVDRLLGTETIVVRPLPPLSFADPIVVGVCLDAEGNPQPVLEPDRLVAAAQRLSSSAERPVAKAKAPILVIDDSLTTRVLEQSILESAGYEVDLAISAEEGLEKARRRSYALFMVDVEMPGMDGFTFVETTRADPVLRATPAILVTSRASPDDLRRGREAGAHAHVVKSEFNQGEVLEIIRRLLE